MFGPPWISWPFVTGVAGVDVGVTEFWLPVRACAACKAAWADAFCKKQNCHMHGLNNDIIIRRRYTHAHKNNKFLNNLKTQAK